MIPICFLWDNFGPLHVDRCEAVSSAGHKVIGLELYPTSDTYGWRSENSDNFEKITLFSKHKVRGWGLIKALLRFRLKKGRCVWFLCHYDWYEIFIFSFFLRILGDHVFVMGCSKFDDYNRYSWREFLKSIFLMNYHGALGSGKRSRDYFRFLGIRDERIQGEYNTVSLARIREMSDGVAPGGTSFSERSFVIVGRFVRKKNISAALHAYSIYKKNNINYRGLQLCGSGPMEGELRYLVDRLGLAGDVVFHGFVQTEEIAKILSDGLALILPSTEEQFGNVIIEAQAVGLPVIVTDNCGGRDLLVRSGVNGFVVEPDNFEGMSWFMDLLAKDEQLWRRMCDAATIFASRSDVAAFAEGVSSLIGLVEESK